ncbi:hypothetical protein MNAN1_000751 [Malassezia nana]|uniref:SH3 domain-containing protein n=1 Tax=Malassezia nana TaxID=180528 RepID=A0AAF0EHD5_9BASI|nr:hypothetical protein MNAN1_000751 [Malassezia nana]
MEGDCRRAKKHHGLDKVIPPSVMKRAKGFAIFTVFRAGFLMSVRAGMGIVVARLPSGHWSAPTAIGVGGLGGGFNAGAEMVDFLIVLNSSAAVRTFMSAGSLQLGGNLSLAVGPLGRTGEAAASINGDMQLAAMFTYCVSRGLYGGLTIEGTFLGDRPETNERTYGRPYTAAEILSGKVEAPQCALPLIMRLEEITGTEEFDSPSPEGVWSPMPGTDAARPPERRRRPPPPRSQASRADTMPVVDGGSMDSVGKGSTGMVDDDEDPFGDTNAVQYDPSTLAYQPRSTFRARQPTSRLSSQPSGLSDAYGLDQSFDADFDMPPPSQSQQRNSASAPAAPLVDAGVLDGDLVVAIHDFTAEKPTDLSFQRGDIIRVTHRTNKSSDWWTGELVAQFSDEPNPSGQYVMLLTSRFPSNYTEPL